MAKSANKCPVCTKPAERAAHAVGHFAEIACDECGHFRVSDTLLLTIRDLGIAARRDALGRAVMRSQYGALPLVTTYDV